ncbi:HNH endonuclease [Corallococcus exiguus]|uniref:HNH endonuclease n=1 Tax=Corallococcus exiguus TaxID=83462 RepID=UPI0014948E9C|nr:HNH endonuclease signature motif containing protein [Corallococcus exiguus]NPC69508.1 HNH endonuclease [Corallococcus exiguus]NPD26123.1 HNH endonuclease [Corallococcus exiguus]
MPFDEFRAWLHTRYTSEVTGRPLSRAAAVDYVSRLRKLSHLTGRDVENASGDELDSFLDLLSTDAELRQRIPLKVVDDVAVAVRRYREFLGEAATSTEDQVENEVVDSARPHDGSEDVTDEALAESVTGRTRSAKHTPEQFAAACEWAAQVVDGHKTRAEAIAALVQDQAMNAGSAEVLLNNYRCLRLGQGFSSPMSAEAVQYFVDSIVARFGAESIPGLMTSLQGYVDYAVAQWGNPSKGVVRILEALRGQFTASEAWSPLVSAATALQPSSPEGSSNLPASEILREIWVRGPQHAAFRRELLRRWSGSCSVHGVPCNGQLRASHIVAWRLDESLRGDVNNGLLLSSPLDALFDQGLISFADDGNLLESDQLQRETALHFGIRPGLRLRWDHLPESAQQAIQANLARHRAFHASEQQHGYAPPASAP